MIPKERIPDFYTRVLSVANYEPNDWPTRRAWTGAAGADDDQISMKVTGVMAEFFEDLGAGRMAFNIRVEKQLGNGSVVQPDDVAQPALGQPGEDELLEDDTYRVGGVFEDDNQGPAAMEVGDAA